MLKQTVSFIFFFFAFCLPMAYAQLQVLPSGVGAGVGLVDRPQGMSANCRSADGDCSFRIEYQATCHGINVRRIPGNAITPDSSIETKITISNGASSQDFIISHNGRALEGRGQDVAMESDGFPEQYRDGNIHSFVFNEPQLTSGIIPEAVGVRNGEVVYDSSVDPQVSVVTSPRTEVKSSFGGGKSKNVLRIEASWPSSSRGFCGSFKSPLMLFFDDQRPSFTGTSDFPVSPDEPSEIYWPEKDAPGYFLAYNPESSREILTGDHLFGDSEGHANGFEKLKDFDSNQDGVINQEDDIFNQLVLWRDVNGDGVAQEDEIYTLEELGVTQIDLNYYYQAKTYNHNRVHSNETSTFKFERDGEIVEGIVKDVWFERK